MKNQILLEYQQDYIEFLKANFYIKEEARNKKIDKIIHNIKNISPDSDLKSKSKTDLIKNEKKEMLKKFLRVSPKLNESNLSYFIKNLESKSISINNNIPQKFLNEKKIDSDEKIFCRLVIYIYVKRTFIKMNENKSLAKKALENLNQNVLKWRPKSSILENTNEKFEEIPTKKLGIMRIQSTQKKVIRKNQKNISVFDFLNSKEVNNFLKQSKCISPNDDKNLKDIKFDFGNKEIMKDITQMRGRLLKKGLIKPIINEIPKSNLLTNFDSIRSYLKVKNTFETKMKTQNYLSSPKGSTKNLFDESLKLTQNIQKRSMSTNTLKTDPILNVMLNKYNDYIKLGKYKNVRSSLSQGSAIFLEKNVKRIHSKK